MCNFFGEEDIAFSKNVLYMYHYKRMKQLNVMNTIPDSLDANTLRPAINKGIRSDFYKDIDFDGLLSYLEDKYCNATSTENPCFLLYPPSKYCLSQ